MDKRPQYFFSQAGNILFLILLAVVLFAALAYAVTNSIRGGGKSGGQETADARTSHALNYLAQMDAAVQRMMLVNNVRDYEINFRPVGGGIISQTTDNTNCTETRCRIFHPDGGNIPVSLLKDVDNQSVTARVFLKSFNGVGSSLPDVALVYYNISDAMCSNVNARIGITGPIYSASISQTTDALLYWNSPYPTGPFPDTTQSVNIPASVGGSSSTFCVCGSSTCTGWYPMLVHIVMQR